MDQSPGGRAPRSPLMELLSGTAFQAHPMDASVELVRRFAGQRLILLMTARDRAATLRVEVSPTGSLRLHGARQIAQRSKGELVGVLRAEAKACGATWVVLSLGSGWQVQYANRSLRGGAGSETGHPELLLRNEPGLFVPKPSGDCLYAAVDHPVLDRSLVFAVKRREVEALAEEVSEAGLGLAAVRVGLASMLEAWFMQQGAAACGRDLLMSDGLGVVWVGFERGDFLSPVDAGGEGLAAPRQYSNRPGDIVQDLARLYRDSSHRDLSFVGPAELDPSAGDPSSAGRVNSFRLEPTEAIFAAGVRHDFHPQLELRRPALTVRVRRNLRLAAWTGALAWATVVALCLHGWSLEAEIESLGQRARADRQAEQLCLKHQEECTGLKAQAMEHLQWLRTHPDAQRLLLRLLGGFPDNVTLERMAAQLDDSGRQMSLEFQLLGTEDGQAAALRAVEQALLGLGYRIGERNTPVPATRGTLHRWRLIIPPAFEGGQS